MPIIRKKRSCVCYKYTNGRKCSVCELAAKKAEKKLSKAEIKKRDEEFFIRVWENSPHVCAETKMRLPEYDKADPQYSFYIRWHIHHILPKSKYPQFRWDDRNVVIVSRDIHDILDHSKPDSVKKLSIYSTIIKPTVDKLLAES